MESARTTSRVGSIDRVLVLVPGLVLETTAGTVDAPALRHPEYRDGF